MPQWFFRVTHLLDEKKADSDKQSVIQYFSPTSSNLISSMLKVRMTETSGITTHISQNSIRLEAMS